MLKLSHLAAGAMFILGSIFTLPAHAEGEAELMDPAVSVNSQQVAVQPLDLNEALDGLIGEGVIIGEALDQQDTDYKSHGCHRKSCLPRCPRCRRVGEGTRQGHCKQNNRVMRCTVSRFQPRPLP